MFLQMDNKILLISVFLLSMAILCPFISYIKKTSPCSKNYWAGFLV
ncbi:hypothetical protein N752_16350 [Desulforamulus aquiferis]|nr:hypothetical protein N752_16350 [Desulforamulus aquiferis]